MKITLHEVRQFVRSVLKESICPVCGSKGAYIGLNTVECPNKSCARFSPEQMNGEPKPVHVMKSVEVDWAADPRDPDTNPQYIARDFGLTAKHVGTNNGYETIRFTGPEGKLRDMMKLHYDPEDVSGWQDTMEDA